MYVDVLWWLKKCLGLEIVRGYLNFSSPISMNLSLTKVTTGLSTGPCILLRKFLLVYMYSNYCLKYITAYIFHELKHSW